MNSVYHLLLVCKFDISIGLSLVGYRLPEMADSNVYVELNEDEAMQGSTPISICWMRQASGPLHSNYSVRQTVCEYIQYMRQQALYHT